MQRKTFIGSLAAIALSVAAVSVQAAWPDRPITLIVPWGAGGGTDATARIIGTLLEKELGPAGQRGQPHRRQRRGRPCGDRLGGARRLHHRPDHGRDRHDALAGPDRPDRRVVHADRPGQRRPGRPAGARRRAVQDGATTCSPRSRPTPASSRPRAPGRAASGTWRSPACCATRRSTRPPCRGCRATAPRRACRTWWPAASRSRPCSLPEARSLIDAGKVQEPGDHERQAGGAVSQRADAEGGDRQRLDAWPPGAASSRPRAFRPTCATSWRPRCKKVAASKDYTEFMASRGFGVIYAGPGRFRQVHGQVGHRARRDDEGRRHRQVGGGVKFNDAVFGRAAARACGAAVLFTCRASRRSRASRSGPAPLPGLIAVGLCVCGAAAGGCAACASAAARRRLARAGRTGSRSPRHVLALGGAARRRSCSTCWPSTGSASCSPARSDLLALMAVLRVRAVARAADRGHRETLLIHFGFYKLLRVPLPWGVLHALAW